MSTIKIYGTLENKTTDNKLAYTNQIYDNQLEQFQSEINQQVIDNKEQEDTIKSQVDQHIKDVNNPHSVTKEQVGLGNVTNDAQVKRSEMGASNGVATLNDLGQVPAHQLPSFVDDVIDVYATYDKSNTGKLSNIKLFSDQDKSIAITGESGKTYIDVEGLYQFRWTGSMFVALGTPTVIGDVPGTAFDGARGKALETSVNNHISDTNNPHGVTKEQVGLGNVDNTSDLNKPISTATQSALNNKVDKVSGKSLVQDSQITKLEGLDDQDTLTSKIADAKKAGTDASSLATQNKNTIDNYTVNGHEISTNPTLNKGDIGLDQVDNTSDLNKPVSNATQEALNNKADITQLVGKVDSNSGGTGEIFNDYTNNRATSPYSHSEGYKTNALGECSHIEGGKHENAPQSRAYGYADHVEGVSNISISQGSNHIEGSGILLGNGFFSHGEGRGVTYDVAIQDIISIDPDTNSITLKGDYLQDTTAAGGVIKCITLKTILVINGVLYTVKNTEYDSDNSKITVNEELNITIDNIQYFSVYSKGYCLGTVNHLEGCGNILNGDYTHAEGYANEVSGISSHIEGYKTTLSGNGSHVEGYKSSLQGDYSHVEGIQNTSSGMGSHAEGALNNISGNYNHVEGNSNTITGMYNHAEGHACSINSSASHVEGQGTTTTNNMEHAEGNFNMSNTGSETKDQTRHSIGIGDSQSQQRRNAQEVMVNGDHYIYGIGNYDGTNYSSAQTLQEVVNNKAESITTVTGSTGEVTQEISPNKFYEFGECSSLTITLGAEISDVYNEYMFQFSSGDTPTVLTLPETVKWIGDSLVDANKTYQVSIVNNIAVMGGA